MRLRARSCHGIGCFYSLSSTTIVGSGRRHTSLFRLGTRGGNGESFLLPAEEAGILAEAEEDPALDEAPALPVLEGDPREEPEEALVLAVGLELDPDWVPC